MKNRPLNILIVSFDWRNIFETNFKELKEKLERDRFGLNLNNIFLVAWSMKSYYGKTENIQTVHCKAFLGSFRVFYDILSIFFVPFMLLRRQFRPDLMVVRDFLMVPAGILVKFFWGTKIVFFLGSMPTNLAKTRKFGFFRWSYQCLGEILAKPFIDVFVANGMATRDYLISMGIRAEDVKVMVENVIERDEGIIRSSRKGSVRERHGIRSDKKILLSVGRLEKEKGFDDLLAAISMIKRQDFILVIVGSGLLKDDLAAQAAKLGLTGRVIFSGFVGREKIWDYYNDADAFILLSRSEGNPTVFREAMYMGVPVIGSHIGPIKEFIGENGVRGFLWDKTENVEKLAEILDKCFNSSEEMAEITERAKRYIQENISGNLMINDFA